MGGLFVLGMIGLWLVFSIWFSQVMVNILLKDGTALKAVFRMLLALFLIALPFIDQLIAYPKWQQLCATTGDFEWGPGMDEKKAFGREVIVFGDIHETSIFPNIHVTYFSRQFKDAQTGELILNMPHAHYEASGMFYIPSDSGNKQAIFLPKCTTKDKSQIVMDYLKKFNLKIVEYRN